MGSQIPKMWFLIWPCRQVTWYGACELPILPL